MNKDSDSLTASPAPLHFFASLNTRQPKGESRAALVSPDLWFRNSK